MAKQRLGASGQVLRSLIVSKSVDNTVGTVVIVKFEYSLVSEKLDGVWASMRAFFCAK